jgi:hypothetical protein
VNVKNYDIGAALMIALWCGGCSDDKLGDSDTPQGSTGAETTSTSGTTSGGTTGTSTTGPTTSTTIFETSGMMGSTGSFIMPKDGGSTGTKECDQWVQDCPRGEKCMPYSGDGDNAWESLKCVQVQENADAVGEPCTVEGSGVSGIDSCEKGAMCWNVDTETGTGVCVAMCIGTPDQPKCADAETSCFNSNDGVLTLCLPKCDPLLQDCEGDDLCIYNPQATSEFLCVLDASGEEGQEFDVCEYINACDKGFFCANPALATECDPMAGGCCLPWCDLSVMPAPCNGVNQECLPWFEMGQAPPGLENLGVCGIPQ